MKFNEPGKLAKTAQLGSDFFVR